MRIQALVRVLLVSQPQHGATAGRCWCLMLCADVAGARVGRSLLLGQARKRVQILREARYGRQTMQHTYLPGRD